MSSQHNRKENIAFLSLGSNIGKREVHLKNAIKLLEANENIAIVEKSSVYETDPIGYENQQAFLNMVIQIKTSLSSFQLLEEIQLIENKGGRERIIRWGPRTIDIDILLFNNENITAENLEIPHPRMFERAFVLIPLLEIEPQMKKNDGSLLKDHLKALNNQDGVRFWKKSLLTERKS